ncbi:hypothetical protein [Ferrimonas aestuarii]|uniref:Type IV pilus assembly protein PilX n=1 Tax=Ferrimonas aestuarii TaxID=2569539 RepID=A0A4U1BGR5_9GAMM|nr:hypothetical protein [Ferrimonas aestuarii]TKB50197.1 hypothetical protein FCL42_19490 [Ferrimonas aestuarii]
MTSRLPQCGMVLISVLALLLIISVVALVSAGGGQIMAQAGIGEVLQHGATQRALGASNRYIETQRLARGDSTFLNSENALGIEDALLDVELDLTHLYQGTCRRTIDADSVNSFDCHQYQLDAQARFGKQNQGRAKIASGVEQPMLVIGQ